MTKISKKNMKVKDFIINLIEQKGFVQDRYGNWKNEIGTYRYKFQTTSYRFEKLINTTPLSWIKISGKYYKDVKMG